MRVLQAIWDGGGNTSPQLAIARELVARGHDVKVLGHDCQRERIEATGARFLRYRHAPQADSSRPETDLLRDWEAKTPLGAFARVRDRLMYGPAGLFARDVIDTLEADPADIVAWDYLLLGAALGAEKAGVPSAAVIHQIYPLPADGVPPFGPGLQPARGPVGRMRDRLIRRVLVRSFTPGLKALNAARSELELPELDDPFGQFMASERMLVLTSPAFDFAGTASLPEQVVYTGPIFDHEAGSGWDSPWSGDDDRPLVLASFSTTFVDQRDLLARTIEALGRLPVRGLVTTGPAVDPAELPDAGNVHVQRFVPHAAVLPHARLAVTHAGMGTVHAALRAGVPLVCLPGGRDQDDVAARVVFHGAGIKLGPRANVQKLRNAIDRGIADESLRAGAARLARDFEGANGPARAADALESLTRE